MDLFDVVETNAQTIPLPYEGSWCKGDGQYALLAMLSFEQYPIGTVFSSTTPNGERMLIVTTPSGNVITVEVNRADRFVVVHTAKLLQGLWGRGRLNDDQLESVLGLWGKDNIGIVLSRLISYGSRSVV